MSGISDIPKEVWYCFIGIIVILYLISNGTFFKTVDTVVDAGKDTVQAGVTLCGANDIVMKELLETSYDLAPANAKKILDKYKDGKQLTQCDYAQLYTSLKEKKIRNWAFDEACNALACTGLNNSP